MRKGEVKNKKNGWNIKEGFIDITDMKHSHLGNLGTTSNEVTECMGESYHEANDSRPEIQAWQIHRIVRTKNEVKSLILITKYR